MISSDFFFVFQWWLVLFLIGLIFLPLAFSFFSFFFDKGYIFSKILGIALLTYLIFILGILHLVPFTTPFTWGIFSICAVLSFAYCFQRKQRYLPIFQSFWKTALFEEILFFLCLCFWSYIRAHQPDIHGLEKYMDFGFVNAILRGKYFPPKDMWLTPLFINYYYFGHLVTAVLTRLSTIPSAITFNLMLATIFAFCFSASFSLGANLIYFLHANLLEKTQRIDKKHWIRIYLGGLLTGYVVSLGGNLHMIYILFKAYPNESPVPPWELLFQPQLFPNGYWYPNATRFIYHTIHEFPSYSFVVSDLHGHVLDIPFVLLTLAIFLAMTVIFFQKGIIQPLRNRQSSTKKNLQTISISSSSSYRYTIITGFMLGVMYMTNAWDGLIYLLFAFLLFLSASFHMRYVQHTSRTIFHALTWGVKNFLIVFLGFIIFSFPFSYFFKPFVSNIGLVCPPDFLIKIGTIGPFIFEPNHCMRSPWWQLLILYGFFYFWVILLIAFLIKRARKQFFLSPVDIFVCLLIICASILIIAPEFVYLKDIYATYFRANTMFKMVYQSFIMLMFVSGYVIIRLFSYTTIKQKILGLPVIILGCVFLTLIALYPYFSVNSYYDNLRTYHSLDGTTYLANLYSTDSQAISWINRHISGQPIMVEAQGDSYTDYERVSANTGLPTILGWSVHEWLWRGTYDVVPPRMNDVQTLYETESAYIAKSIIQKYNVSYIFIGDLERKKYKLSEEKFKELGKVIYQNGITTIYQIKK